MSEVIQHKDQEELPKSPVVSQHLALEPQADAWARQLSPTTWRRELGLDGRDVPERRKQLCASEETKDLSSAEEPGIALEDVARFSRVYQNGLRRAGSFLHPLTQDERLLVSEQIRHDVTNYAVELLRHEQETKARLQTVHIKCVSLMVIAACALGYAIVYLQGVLVPFILAIFFMFLLEPLLFGLLKLPRNLLERFPSFRILALAEEGRRQKVQERRGIDEDDISRDPSFASDPGSMFEADVVTRGCRDTTRAFLQSISWRTWGFMSVLLCLSCLVGAIAGVIFFLVKGLDDFPWNKYSESKNLKMVVEWFPQIAADNENLKFESFMPWLVQGFLVDAIDLTFTIISMTFLTLLFLAFLLANDVDLMENEGFFGIAEKVRIAVRRYIRIKSQIAAVVACLIGLIYWWLKVDLAFLFAIVTFVLSYIPHVGYTIAVLAPLPLVFLDPTKTWGDLAITFIFPFIIHQFASNLIEPKLLASSLDLHPIIVLLALAFWTTVWGAVGAILSVPLTAVVRLILLEIDHPYTQPVVNLLKGNLKPKSANRGQDSLSREASFSPRHSPPSSRGANARRNQAALTPALADAQTLNGMQVSASAHPSLKQRSAQPHAAGPQPVASPGLRGVEPCFLVEPAGAAKPARRIEL